MILDDIVFNKRQEVTLLKVRYEENNPTALLKNLPKPRDFLKAFPKGEVSLIAEVKKASPSAGVIREDFDPVALAKTFESAGAAAISVLTDEKFFQGKISYLKAIKEAVNIPVLRKDFIIDESQIYEARLNGADAVLLIVRLLDDAQLAAFLRITKDLGMQALVEVHAAEELKRVLKTNAKMIGINNRDLNDFSVNFNTTLDLIKHHPKIKGKIIVSESGIKNKQDVAKLKKAGVRGILVGESLMRSDDVPAKVGELIK
jgi:indole-3-glycerol phosphate synthase